MTSVWRRHRRALVASAATLVVLAPLGWLWTSSLVPDTYSVMDMGYADFGGGPGSLEHAAENGRIEGAAIGHVAHGAGGVPSSADVRDVTTLTGPREGEPDVAITLTARQELVEVDGGRAIEGYTLNGSSPGPEIRAVQGDLVEVTLANESVDDGTTLHWHGVDVPNAEDGVAGVTQDAVGVGSEHVYRFVAEDAGTYWYHSHQVSHEQVRDGLFGVLVVEPRDGLGTGVTDVVAAVHSYDSQRTVNGRVGETRVDAEPGDVVRVRVINTDDGPMNTWVAGAPYRVVAVDGVDLSGPTDIEETALLVTAGGRADLELTVPDQGAVRIGAGGGATSLVIGPDDAAPPGTELPASTLDLLSYGEPEPLALDVDDVDRDFEYAIGRRPGFLDGRPGLWWTINGGMYPDVPMFVVSEGDVVRMTISNSSGQVHPMHLHGHHAVVLSRNGIDATGSPW
ncbi:MAG TPA: multicopper oxidase family protein, partial [Actinomycetales bacterium]|nr:multicopper oxidase family protein [Actinomycetales bacterium]